MSDPPPADSVKSAPASDDPLIGSVFAERYRVEELIGQGAMGTVYRAAHIHMRKAVAIKLLNPEIARLGEMAARFEREAVAAGRIEHPHVAKAMDFGRTPDGGCYLVLEYVAGQRLSEVLANGPLPAVRAMRIARQIADAMSAAHEAGVVHRDLKPDNVMLSARDDAGDFVKVLDFGVAKLSREPGNEASPITRFGAVLGTPEYMAPEQAGGGVVDHRADLYALGVIFYEMLAGHPPFVGEDAVATLTKQLTEPLPYLPEAVPPAVAVIVARLVEKDADERIQSARELIAHIDAAFTEIEAATTVIMVPEPTLAGTTHDGVPRTKRRSLVVPLALGAALLVVCVGGAAVAFAAHANVETMRANRARVDVPKISADPAPSASASAGPTSEEPAASAAEPESEPEPAASGSAPEAQPKSAPAPGKVAKAKPAPKKTTTTAKPKRKTGPFGIYIPPPSQW